MCHWFERTLDTATATMCLQKRQLINWILGLIGWPIFNIVTLIHIVTFYLERHYPDGYSNFDRNTFDSNWVWIDSWFPADTRVIAQSNVTKSVHISSMLFDWSSLQMSCIERALSICCCGLVCIELAIFYDLNITCHLNLFKVIRYSDSCNSAISSHTIKKQMFHAFAFMIGWIVIWDSEKDINSLELISIEKLINLINFLHLFQIGKMVDCGVTCAKYSVFFFNLLFAVCIQCEHFKWK